MSDARPIDVQLKSLARADIMILFCKVLVDEMTMIRKINKKAMIMN